MEQGMDLESEDIILVTKDGQKIKVDSRIRIFVSLIDQTLEDSTEDEIKLNVEARHIQRIIQYANNNNFTLPKPIPKPLPHGDIYKFVQKQDLDLLTSLGQDELAEFIKAIDFLQSDPLTDLVCAWIASQFKQKNILDIEKEYQQHITPTVDDQIKQQYKGLFEDINLLY